jgi:predicted nucleotidyltransferase
VRTASPSLLPLFRSEKQARLLTQLFLVAPEGSSLADLARATGITSGAVHREVERLERAGIVRSHRVGRTRVVEPDPDSPFYADLRSLLMAAFGPVPVLTARLQGVGGIERAFIFGSWARAEHGELDRPPRDIDLMVIGEVDLDQLYERLREAEAELGRPVNVNVFTATEWATDDSGFAREVKSQPVVPLLSADDD